MTSTVDHADEECAALLELPAEARLDRLRAVGRPEAVASSLVRAAEGMLLTDLARGLEVTASAVDLVDAIAAAPITRAMARRVRAQALAYANRFEDALAVLDEAIALAETHDEPVEAARARMTSLHALARLGRLADAQTIGELARDAFRDAGEHLLAAKAELNIGAVLRMNDDPAGAIEHYDRARPLVRDDPVLLAQLDSNRGEAMLDLNRFADAEDAFAGSMTCFEKAKVHRAAAIVAGNLGDLTGRQGRFQEALRHFERARRHLETEAASAEIARVIAESAEVVAALGLPEDARREYLEALPALREHGLALETARALTGYGRTLLDLGRHADAEEALAEAVERFKGLGIETGVARVRILQAQLFVRTQRRDEALASLREALAVLEDRPGDAAVVRGRLAALTRETDPAAAAALIEHAIADAEALDLQPVIADLLLVRAGLRDRDDERLADLREAVASVEHLLGGLPAGSLRAAFLGDRMDAYETLVAALAEQPEEPGRCAEAFAAAESAKSRVFLDQVLGSFGGGVKPAGSDEVTQLQEVARLRGELAALYGRLLDLDSADAVERSLLSEAVREREERLATLDRRLAVARDGRGLITPSVGLDDVAPLLPPDTALIEYFIARDEVLAFVVRRDRTTLHGGLADATTVRRLVNAVRFQISRAAAWRTADGRVSARLVDDARRAAGMLHDAIMGPLSDAIGDATRLIVVPHGPLHAVPIGALHDGRRYLLEAYEVEHVPSASVLRHLATRRASGAGTGRCLVVSVPDELAPEIGREVREVAAALDDAVVLENDAATVDGLRTAIAGAPVVHLACHGRFTASTPMASGIRLADRWLSIREIQEIPIDGAHVTLSACETGMSASGRAEDLVGLVRAFLAAGAASVACSLWPVEDKSTRKLMVSAYTKWQNNQGDHQRGFGVALREAQREWLEEQRHPLYWAPFIVVGGG